MIKKHKSIAILKDSVFIYQIEELQGALFKSHDVYSLSRLKSDDKLVSKIENSKYIILSYSRDLHNYNNVKSINNKSSNVLKCAQGSFYITKDSIKFNKEVIDEDNNSLVKVQDIQMYDILSIVAHF